MVAQYSTYVYAMWRQSRQKRMKIKVSTRIDSTRLITHNNIAKGSSKKAGEIIYNNPRNSLKLNARAH